MKGNKPVLNLRIVQVCINVALYMYPSPSLFLLSAFSFSHPPSLPSSLPSSFPPFLSVSLEIDSCSLQPYKGPCNGQILRYFYNSTSQKCEVFYFGGCHSNENNFFTQHDCEEKCSCKFYNVKHNKVMFLMSLCSLSTNLQS